MLLGVPALLAAVAQLKSVLVVRAIPDLVTCCAEQVGQEPDSLTRPEFEPNEHGGTCVGRREEDSSARCRHRAQEELIDVLLARRPIDTCVRTVREALHGEKRGSRP